MGFARPSTELNNLGYNISVDMGKTLSITPTLDYNYSKHIAFQLQTTIDSERSIRSVVSTTFKISKASNISVGFMTDFQKFTNLSSTTIILGYVYMGYVLKIPIFTCDQVDNGWGIALTLGGFIASNIAGY